MQDPALSQPINGFSYTDTETLPLVFSLLNYPSYTAPDPKIFTLTSTTTNPPVVKVSTADNKNMGNHEFVIRAKFDIRIPYYVDSPPFTIQILHACVRNVIIGTTIGD